MSSHFFEIEKLDTFGRGISNLDGKICFIENAIDKEKVEAEITLEKKNINEAKTVKVIESSPDRKKWECPYYLECGGCNIMHMTYAKQLKFKEEKVRDILKSFADIDKGKVKNIIPTLEFSYRNKVTLKVKEKLGYYKKKTYEIINIDKCLIASSKINTLIAKLNEMKLSGIKEIIIRSNNLNSSLVALYSDRNLDCSYYSEQLKDYTDNLIIYEKKRKKVILGHDYIEEKLRNFTFRVSPDSFFQVNSYGALKLYEEIEKEIEKTDTILDLYCGTGTIGIFLSHKAKKVIGVEICKSAIINARQNKIINKVDNIEFICDDVAKVKERFYDVDLVVIDPPRGGLSKNALKNVIDTRAKRIIYASCDVVTLARDLNILKEYYEIEKVVPVDMFPNTYHVECVCVLNLL